MSLTKEHEVVLATVKKMTGHKCKLLEDVESVGKFIKFGHCVPLRRNLKKSTILSKTHPETTLHFKSSHLLENEEMRQLSKYFTSIHPLSEFVYYRNNVMIFIYIIQLFMPNFLFYDSMKDRTELGLISKIVGWISVIACTADMFLCFNIGYYDKVDQKFVLKKEDIAKHYFKTYFVFDFLTIFQLGIISSAIKCFHYNLFFNFQWLIKLPRLITLVNSLNTFRKKQGWSWYIYKTFINCLFLHLSWTWFVFGFYLLKINSNPNYVETNGVLRSLTFIEIDFIENYCGITAKYFRGEVNDHKDWLSKLFHAVGFHYGFFNNLFFTALFLQIYVCYNMPRNRYFELLDQINAYTSLNGVPQRVNERIQSYIRFKYQKSVFKETTIFHTLSMSLKNEVVWDTCQNLISKVDVFKEVPLSVMMKIVMLMKYESFLPNDVVVQAGDVGTEMYFINIGVLAVFSPSGKEICHLSDGDHFGEISLLFHETRIASVVAIDFCELLRLSKRDFMEAIDLYPSVKLKMLELAESRLKNIKKFCEMDLNDEICPIHHKL